MEAAIGGDVETVMSSNFDLVSLVGEQSRELEIVSPHGRPFQHLQGLSLSEKL